MEAYNQIVFIYERKKSLESLRRLCLNVGHEIQGIHTKII